MVVDDFGVKYVKEEDVHHLEKVLEAFYPCKSDWTGNRYVGVHLNWDYNKRTLRTSMPGYVKKVLLQFGYKPKNGRIQHSPSPYTAPNYGQKVQMTDLDLSPAFTEADKTKLQQSNGKFLYYGRAVDDTMLHILNHLATKIKSGTENTMKSLTHFLDYCYHHVVI